MDDFLNFFKTSLFWSPIRGCSLKQRLKEKKHSCSAMQKNLPQKNNGTHQKIQTIKATVQSKRPQIRSRRVLTSHSCTGRSSNMCCFSRAGCRTCAMMTGRVPEVQKWFYIPSLSYTFRLLTMFTVNVFIHVFLQTLNTEFRSKTNTEDEFITFLVRGEWKRVSYVTVRCSLTGVILTPSGIQRPEVLQYKKYHFYHCTLHHFNFSLKHNESEGKKETHTWLLAKMTIMFI